VEGVDNPLETTNGTDALTDTQVESLIMSTARGNIGTTYGYKALVDGNFSFKDSVVVPSDDPEAVRASSGAAVDIILLSNSAQSVSETFLYSDLITLSRQPVQAVTGVTINGVATEYTVNYDTASQYSGSQAARTTVTIPGAHLATDIVQVSYKYNPDVSSVQSFFDLPTNKVLGADVMVKQATRITMGVHADIVALPGYSLDSILPSASQKIVDLFNTQLLGQEMQKTDIINAIYGVTGVDYVNTGTFELRRKVGTEWQADQETVSALKREVITLATTDAGAYEIYLNEVAPWQ
jgi:hypothetical protein